MGRKLTFLFTSVSGFCTIFLILSFTHFIIRVNKKTSKKTYIDPLVKTCACISLFGYTLFVLISFILHLIQSLWFVPNINITYTTLMCQLQTFNVVFFMMGKLSMYLFFLSLIHISFKGSFLAYSPKLLRLTAAIFFVLMCIIGGFYMVLLYFDFQSVGSIISPNDCQKFKASTYTSITIWIGATCDALWSFTCLILFYLRLRKITKIMEKQLHDEQRDIDNIEKKYQNTSTNSTTTTQSNETMSIVHEEVQLAKLQMTVSNSGKDGYILSEESSSYSDTESDEFEPENNLVGVSDYMAKMSQYKKDKKQSNVDLILNSIQLKLNDTTDKFKKKLKRKRKKRKKPDIVHKFLPIMLKLSILSAWCAFSTIGLGFGLWTLYPTLSSVIDSTINAFCVYLSFGFTKNLYQILCLPFISCKACSDTRQVVNEADQMQRDKTYDMEQTVLG